MSQNTLITNINIEMIRPRPTTMMLKIIQMAKPITPRTLPSGAGLGIAAERSTRVKVAAPGMTVVVEMTKTVVVDRSADAVWFKVIVGVTTIV